MINQASVANSKQSKVVLLVDDSADICDLFGWLAEYSHFCLITARDGLEGLKKLAGLGADPEILFVDLMMPGMGGIEFLKRVNALGLATSSRIVICSGSEKNFAKAPPMSDWLAKPFEIKDVLRLIFGLNSTEPTWRFRPKSDLL